MPTDHIWACRDARWHIAPDSHPASPFVRRLRRRIPQSRRAHPRKHEPDITGPPLEQKVDRLRLKVERLKEANRNLKIVNKELNRDLKMLNKELRARRRPWGKRGPPSYYADRLAVWGKSTKFLEDDRFTRAYRRGKNSGHLLGDDLHIEWRVVVCCWAAQHGAHLPGDFVECGVNTGIFSLAVCEYVDFNRLDKSFWLFDTYKGLPVEQISERELATGKLAMNSHYFDCFETTRANFLPFPRAKLVRGAVPDTLTEATIDRVAYLSIDMNIAYPEREALEFFWPKLTSGAAVVLDDYGWEACSEQRDTADEFASQVGIEILSLPTGQGLLLKP